MPAPAPNQQRRKTKFSDVPIVNEDENMPKFDDDWIIKLVYTAFLLKIVSIYESMIESFLKQASRVWIGYGSKNVQKMSEYKLNKAIFNNNFGYQQPDVFR